jgi:hypothetical protein
MPNLCTAISSDGAPTDRPGAAFPADSRFCLPNHPGLLGSFNQREKKFDLVVLLVAVHGRMGA